MHGPHFLLGFPRDASRKESDCHGGQQGNRKRNGLSPGKDGSTCGSDSEVRRKSKEGEGPVPTAICTSCAQMYSFICSLIHANRTGTLRHRYTHTHTGFKHPQEYQSMLLSVPSHAYISRHKVLGLCMLTDMPIHTHWHMELQIYSHVLRYQHSSTYSRIHILVTMQTHALLHTQTHKSKDTQIRTNLRLPTWKLASISIMCSEPSVHRDSWAQTMDLNSSTAIYPSQTWPCSRQYFKQRTNAMSVAFNDTHVHTLFRAVSNLSFKPPLCQRLPPPKVCSQDPRQLPLCPCRWYPAAWSWGRPQHTTWRAPWRTWPSQNNLLPKLESSWVRQRLLSPLWTLP